jgi:hypothetical protein
MEYSKIIAITGMPGLYEMMNSKGDGAIVRSLDDQSTKFVSGRVHQFTHLESIEVYTERENVNLTEVLNAMKDSSEKVPDEKDNKALEAYFRKVYPTLDFDRVYASDMKKMVKWFNALSKNNVEIKLSEPEEEPAEEPAPAEEAGAEMVVTKPAKAKAKPASTEGTSSKETKAKETKAKEPKEAKAKETKAKDAKPAKAAKAKEAAPAKKASKAAPAKKAATKAPKKKKK